MRLSRLFVGGYEEIRRPVIPVDESLIDRIEKARQRLVAEGKEVVSVRVTRRAEPKTPPPYVRGTPKGVASPSTPGKPFNRAA